MFLYDLPPHRKNVPELIVDPVRLIKDVRSLVERHCKDNPETAVTGTPVLRPELNRSPNATPVSAALQSIDGSGAPHTEQSSQMHVNDSGNVSDDGETTANNFVSPKAVAVKNSTRGPYKKQSGEGAANGGASNGRLTEKTHHNNSANVPRRRRRRCKTCVPCNSTECGHCAFCLDMVSDLAAGRYRIGLNVAFLRSFSFSLQIKFGGPGRAKQTCMMRQCLQPMLPVTAQCVFCNLDGWRQPPVTSPQAKSHVSQDMGPSTLMECSVCYEIAHADCAQKANSETSQVNGVVNEDLPNSWECPTCCVSGKNNDYKVPVSPVSPADCRCTTNVNENNIESFFPFLFSE